MYIKFDYTYKIIIKTNYINFIIILNFYNK